ncbi:Ubiquitin-like-conjugating enzyme Atg3/Atg10 [Dillenia turbinata]|uniref:Ubiquitin-like-conjugating enzyme ATG10 n=1 Tax=Dillenia turbinata TaxID=194707 RepID=A0AAN8VUH8_9MAGN
MVLNQKKENISFWDGTLSLSEFYVGASAFAEKWRLLHHAVPPWSWIPCSRVPWPSTREVDGYLSLEKFNIFRSSEYVLHLEQDDQEEGPNEIEEASCSGKGKPFDNAVVVQRCSPEVYYSDLHIVYSASYKVPVLYFRVYSSDGQTIELNNIEKFLPVSSAKVLRESKWTFITQEEHPYLRRPWYTLHPCGTGEWMKLLLLADAALAANGFTSEQYIVSWMSVVGQVVGIQIPHQLLNG